MRKAADLVATIREYEDDAGRPAKVQIRVGTLFRDDSSGRLSIKLDAIPLPGTSWGGWLACRRSGDAEEDDTGGAAPPGAAAGGESRG